MSAPYAGLYLAAGARVAAERDAAGLTQGELAARIGLTRTSVVNIEAGRQRAGLHVYAAIADVLGVPLAALLPAGRRDIAEELKAAHERIRELERKITGARAALSG